MLLEHLAVDLEPVPEQDHDQGDGGETADERRARIEVDGIGAAGTEERSRSRRTSRQRQEASSRESGDERTDHEQTPEREQRRVEARAVGREQQRHLHVGYGHAIRVSDLREERRGDHGPGQVAGVAGRRRAHVVDTSSARATSRCCSTAATACSPSSASDRLPRRLRGADQPPARRPLPRPRPVQLRAVLRATPTTRAVAGGRDRPSGRPQLYAPVGAAEFFRASSAAGATRG